MTATRTADRRPLKFASEDEAVAELKRLRCAPVRRLGTWSLAQMSSHLAGVMERSMVPPPTDIPTAEETERKNKFFAMVLGPDGVPEGMPLPPTAVPSPDCKDAEVDRLIAAFEAIKAYPHKCVTVGKCGPVPVVEIRPLHLAHAAHHLSFLVPVQRRDGLKFETVDAAIADVKRLRTGYVRTANWTLPQVGWHMHTALGYFMSPGPHAEAAPRSPEMQERLNGVLKTGRIPNGIQSPERVTPPNTASDEDVDKFIGTLERVKSFPGPFGPHPLFGKLTDDEARPLILIHVAHHLSYLVPTTTA